jgi:hypothetical protein
MTITNFEIPDGIYSNKLLQFIWGKQFDETLSQQTLSILNKLSRINLHQIQEKKDEPIFEEDENEIIFNTEITSICSNKEIIALWCDYSQLSSKKKRKENTKLACLNYLEVFKQTNEYEYLIRKLQIIRSRKGVFVDELNSHFDYIKEIIFKCKYPFIQKQLLEELIHIYGQQKCKDEFETFLIKQENLLIQKEDFDGSRFVIQSLSMIGTMDRNQQKIRLAENFESEGDYFSNKGIENTFYSNISEIYLDGLRELKTARSCATIKQRIEKKALNEQKKFVEFLKRYGPKTSVPIDIFERQKRIFKLGVNDFKSAFDFLRYNMPIISESGINNQVQSEKQNRSILESIAKNKKLNESGNVVGISTGDQALISSVRSYQREIAIVYITTLKHIIDINDKIDASLVSSLLNHTKSRFIPKDRIEIYTRGIHEGFENNFIVSAHILMPQIENSIRYIAEQNDISTTKTDEELQHENTLGGCLEKIKEITDQDLFSELKNFLTDTDSVNFRNELAHGLMDSFLLQHYGKYLWWLSLKMIFQTNNYFKLPPIDSN